MLQSEVINKLAMELCLANGDFDHFQNNCIYIQRALSIGIEHYSIQMEEIVVLTKKGVEIGRYKSIAETSTKLGLHERNISAVINSEQHSSGGYLFMKAKDYELTPRNKK